MLRRALRQRPDDTALGARILLTLAWSEAEQGRLEASFGHLDEAAVLAAGHPGLAGITSGQRGLLLLRLGRAQEALAYLRRALPLLDGQPIEQVRALLHQGVAEKDLRRYRAAEASFLQSAALAKEHQHAILAGKATSNLGELAALRGDLPLAIARFDEAAEIFREADPILRAITVVDSGYALTQAGLFSEAAADLLDAAELLGAARLPLPEAEAWLSLAELALTEERAAEATQYARKALRGFRRRGFDGGELMARAVLAATATVTRRTIAGVRERTDEVAADLAVRGLTEEAARLRLRVARSATRAGVLDIAEELAGSAYRTGSGTAIRTRILGHTVRAELAAATGDRARKRREVRSGLAALQRHQARLGSFDLQTAVVRHGVDLAGLGLADAVAVGHPGQVLTWLERTRALATRIPPVRPPDDDTMASLLESLRHERLELTQMERRRDVDLAEVAALRARCRALEKAAGARERQLVGSGDVHAEASAATVSASVGADGHLVAVFDVEDQLHAVVVAAQAAELVTLGPARPVLDLVRRTRADLDVLALASTPATMRAVVLASLRRSLAALDELLWSGLCERTGDGQLVLVPTGLLATLPWTLLPRLRGRPIAVARSAGEWLRGHEWPPPGRRGRSELGSGPTIFATGPRVDRGQDEIESCAASWASATLLPLASAQSLLDHASGAEVLHVAAHGAHDQDNPLFSSLELQGGLVFGHDLSRMPLPPRHVVLSACDLGLATVRPGGESLGMTAALLHGGTGSVVAGVARVSDHVARDVAVAYHQRLSAGDHPSYALAGALAATGADGSGDQLAPLTCFGAGW
jgi:tetratricopeptide (TPR) repeat protein